MEFQEKVTSERAVLAGLNCDLFTEAETATDATLDELEALLETAGGECVGKVLQNRPKPDPHSFFGDGKVQEIRDLLESQQASLLIVDNELGPSQIRALEELTGVTVLDRSALILDIFAQRAKTREGRLQVELAQYRYLLPKLSGMGTSMSRLGGGIGTRGPGETKLETDRRHIRARIQRLEEELEEVRRVRAVQRSRRQKNNIPVVALVGYTNAGKSTLLNALTDAGIPANNRLFDTLDTTTRQWEVTDTLTVLLSDTVGFIAKLPHHLIEAFKATLEELRYADALVHVVDVADPDREEHLRVVQKLIGELAEEDTPVILCYNQCDRMSKADLPHDPDAVFLSAKTGEGMEQLAAAVQNAASRGKRRVTLLLPYEKGGIVQTLHDTAQVLSCDYEQNGIRVEAICDEETCGRLRAYLQ
ncbi:MAG: GTPase HflX [Oscillospiraceae bacterium]|nr:GTPase HflX [Oscillospiraceae bacterium]